MMTVLRLAGLMSLAMLAACNGNPPAATYAQMLADSTSLTSQFTSAPSIAGAGLPTAGTVDYAGIISTDLTDGTNVTTVLGDVALTVDFNGATGGVTGTVDNVRAADDSLFTGTLAVTAPTGGALDRASTGFGTLTADLDGTLLGPDAVSYLVDGNLTAGFSGTGGPDNVGGPGTGTVTTASGSSPMVIDFFATAQN